MDILYLDDVMIAVHKPSGLLVHRSLIDKHETRVALQRVRDQIGQRLYPVHRLDKPTSGILVFALNPATARALTAQFIAGHVQKTYRAIVRGYTDRSYGQRDEVAGKPI
jgi:tRNA pseudouridine65 synthase